MMTRPATERPKVRADVRRRLVDEAGGKCANPGCPTPRTHLHHIAEWAVYQAHDEEEMIAVCPTCHDAIHDGQLEIDDDTIYAWKAIERPKSTRRDHVYVEPGESPTLAIGTMSLVGNR